MQPEEMCSVMSFKCRKRLWITCDIICRNFRQLVQRYGTHESWKQASFETINRLGKKYTFGHKNKGSKTESQIISQLLTQFISLWPKNVYLLSTAATMTQSSYLKKSLFRFAVWIMPPKLCIKAVRPKLHFKYKLHRKCDWNKKYKVHFEKV